MLALRLAVAFALAGLALTAGAAPASDSRTAVLRLDGLLFRPELALTPAKRSLGLMHRTKAPADGMLFVFPTATTGGFWMKNTLVPLTIAFFDTRGKRIRRLSMTPCRTPSCPVYDPGRSYRFALELSASDVRPARTLGPLADLRRLSLLAS